MMNYSFFAPRQIVFGWGRRSELGGIAAQHGTRAFLVSGSRTLEKNGRVDELVSVLEKSGLEVLGFPVASREPQVRDVDELVTAIRDLAPSHRDVVIGVGGGSTIDLAKAAAALATNTHGDSVVDFLEGVGRGFEITESPLPLIAIPTTAGTGAEATKNAVISSNNESRGDRGADFQMGQVSENEFGTKGSPFKKSLRSDSMVPRVALVDPELCVSVPSKITAETGMDAITQLIESHLSRRSAPIPQALCEQGLKLAIQALPLAVSDGTHRAPREAMSHAALLSGIALANSGLGLAHGVAAALGVTCNVPHGLACAVMLPVALQYNLPVRMKELAGLERLMDPDAGIDQIAANSFIDRIETLCDQLCIPRRLRDIGVEQEQLGSLVSGSRGNSMSGNPREITDAKLLQLLKDLW